MSGDRISEEQRPHGNTYQYSKVDVLFIGSTVVVTVNKKHWPTKVYDSG